MKLIALLLVLGSTHGADTGQVHGVVRSSDGGRPVAYANVEVAGQGLAAWTDAGGVYRLDALPEGRWRVRVVHPNHDPLSFEVFVAAGRSLALDVVLQAKPGPAVDALADFAPFRVEYTLPALLNGDEVSALIAARYPAHLLELGAAGEAVLRLWLDERGQVVRGIVASSSGYPGLDSIAVAVAARMRFRAAKNRGEAVRVIVQIPVVFTTPPAPPVTASGG